jgi:hypothetical protein
MVAALIVERQGPASRSAALRMIEARSSYDIARQAGAASAAALTAAWASRFVEFLSTPSTDLCSCGWTTWISAPPPITLRPPMVAVRSTGPAAARWASSASMLARSALPGA